MGIKAKLGMSIATGVLAFGLIGGGTYAYFSDTESNISTFAAGKMDISVKGNDTANALIAASDIKPGDTFERSISITNTGSVDVSKLLLSSNFSVKDKEGKKKNNDFGDHIRVKISDNNGQAHIRTLNELTSQTGIELLNLMGAGDIGVNKSATFNVEFEFLDNDADQNQFQEQTLTLDLSFEARTGK